MRIKAFNFNSDKWSKSASFLQTLEMLSLEFSHLASNLETLGSSTNSPQLFSSSDRSIDLQKRIKTLNSIYDILNSKYSESVFDSFRNSSHLSFEVAITSVQEDYNLVLKFAKTTDEEPTKTNLLTLLSRTYTFIQMILTFYNTNSEILWDRKPITLSIEPPNA